MRRRRRRRRTALIKSNNPHLAGGEKQTRGFQVVRQMVLDGWLDNGYGWLGKVLRLGHSAPLI